MNYQYSAFNLEITSSFPLPELNASVAGNDDVLVKLLPALTRPSETPGELSHYDVTPKSAFLRFSEVGEFRITDGRLIEVAPWAGTEESLIRLPLLGAVFAVLLFQRGALVLHASTAEIGNRAVAFVGEKGDGKSTLAAALENAGCALLTDDTTAIDISSEVSHPTVRSGFPQIKLYPDAVTAATTDDPADLPEIASNADKRLRRSSLFQAEPVPLAAVCVLAEGPGIEFVRLGAQDAMRTLITHSYMARFSADWLRHGIALTNFRQCSELVNQIPVYRFERPRDLSKLRDGVDAVISQFS